MLHSETKDACYTLFEGMYSATQHVHELFNVAVQAAKNKKDTLVLEDLLWHRTEAIRYIAHLTFPNLVNAFANKLNPILGNRDRVIETVIEGKLIGFHEAMKSMKAAYFEADFTEINGYVALLDTAREELQ